MTNPTLERAARACARAFYDTEALDEPIFFEAFSGKSVDWLVDQYWLEFVPEARAVLMAVRDCPNLPGMISVNGGRITANECMREFIDAILNEDEEE